MLSRVTALALLAATAALAADWPQWRGPDRTGLSAETGLLKEWPKDGPALLWKTTGLGGGYSTPAIVGGRMYLLGAKGLKGGGGKGKGGGGGANTPESLLCLDLTQKGKPLWALDFGSTMRSYPGPRGTPTIDGDRAYAISSDGHLVCATTAGKLVWKKSLTDDFGGRFGNWNYAESPLIDGDRLVCTPGGKDATIVCLNKADGSVVWKGPVSGVKDGKLPGTTAGYSSVIKATVAGTPTYVQMIQGGVVGLDAATGKQLWHYDNPASTGANISTPIVAGDSVFAASAYGNGGGRADVSKSSDGFVAKEKYFLSSFQNHHGGVVLVGGHLFGTGNQSLVCINHETGKVEWSERGVGKGSVAFADGMIYQRGEDGGVALVEANPAKYVEKGRFQQPDRSSQKAWPHPVVSDGKLYLRDWDGLLCYDVKAK